MLNEQGGSEAQAFGDRVVSLQAVLPIIEAHIRIKVETALDHSISLEGTGLARAFLAHKEELSSQFLLVCDVVHNLCCYWFLGRWDRYHPVPPEMLVDDFHRENLDTDIHKVLVKLCLSLLFGIIVILESLTDNFGARDVAVFVVVVDNYHIVFLFHIG